MNIVEIRDLDGPNLFLEMPAIKLEVETAGDPVIVDEQGSRIQVSPDDMMEHIRALVVDLHKRCGLDAPKTATRTMEAEGHYTVAFSWSHRRFAEALGKLALDLLAGNRSDIESGVDELRAILESEPEADDAPEMVPTASRTVPVIAVTGTNGKTTTSRVIASVLRHAGKSVGLTSSSGVYINGEQVISGDYSGPSGAHRVFEEPGVDVAVLETARGGMLLRGMAFESADVSVVTNVSEDHLGLHGIYSIEKLTEVKALVPKYTWPDGFAVLNADDPRVFGMREVTPARPLLVTRRPPTADIERHIAEGGWALTVDDALRVIWSHDGEQEVLTSLNDVPMTFSGRAPHMVENALCAAGALLGIGLSPEQVREGLAEFRNTSSHNKGRLNVYDLNGATIVLDFAHNVAGLEQLISFGKSFLGEGGELTAVIGTAGDREDSVFRGLAKHAALHADRLVLKDSQKYLRGREMGDMPALMRSGVAEAGRDIPVDEAESERSASLMAFERARPGDVVVLMCIEDYDYLIPWLDERGTAIS